MGRKRKLSQAATGVSASKVGRLTDNSGHSLQSTSSRSDAASTAGDATASATAAVDGTGFFANLPVEILLHLLQFVSAPQIAQIRRLSYRFNEVIVQHIDKMQKVQCSILDLRPRREGVEMGIAKTGGVTRQRTIPWSAYNQPDRVALQLRFYRFQGVGNRLTIHSGDGSIESTTIDLIRPLFLSDQLDIANLRFAWLHIERHHTPTTSQADFVTFLSRVGSKAVQLQLADQVLSTAALRSLPCLTRLHVNGSLRGYAHPIALDALNTASPRCFHGQLGVQLNFDSCPLLVAANFNHTVSAFVQVSIAQ